MIALKRHNAQRTAMLRHLELFSGCNRNELSRIDSLMTSVTMDRGTVLVEEGKAGLEFFVIVKGRATASRQGLWLAEFGPGSFFGELALLDRGTRTATVTADTDISLLVFSRPEFWSLQRSVPSVVDRMAVELSRRLRSTNEILDQESACSPLLRPILLRQASGN